jgi:REP-associated tyrosine transposase
MPRANRYRQVGHVWHLTQRCHRRQFLLKFARDRRAWIRWLYEARTRYGLSVLNYQVTSNHVHLLVVDRDRGEIAPSLQLIAACVGRAYNRRKRRPGAFWEDSYHATAVDTDEHLARCLTYIDLNMVRAGVVEHPRQWLESGYQEIQQPRTRYRIIDREALCSLLGTTDENLGALQNEWIEAAVATGRREREPHWSEAVAVGRRSFVEDMKAELGIRAFHRCIEEVDGAAVLRDPTAAYRPHLGGEMATLSANWAADSKLF